MIAALSRTNDKLIPNVFLAGHLGTSRGGMEEGKVGAVMLGSSCELRGLSEHENVSCVMGLNI